MIGPNEEQIIGNWTLRHDEVRSDDACRRIESLISSYLHQIAVGPDGWDVLYSDPADRRLWELTYPESEMHGGGPPALHHVSGEVAAQKYGMQCTSD